MYVITARNVNNAYEQGIELLSQFGETEQTRNGPARVAPMPVTTHFQCPRERILWDEVRDANPFFHFFESFWMLAGRNDVDYLTDFVKKMADFSDDGETFHGAYGFRWRQWFGFDQIEEAIDQLQKNPASRRCIITMWSPNGDMVASEGVGGGSSKDLPCNLMIKLEARKGVLDMVVFNRSNDMIWGAYGANVVHFSVLQEYIAARLRIPTGGYWQVSSNFHAYEEVWKAKTSAISLASNPYEREEAVPYYLFDKHALIATDLIHLLETDAAVGYHQNFFLQVGHTMKHVWRAWKSKDRGRAFAILDGFRVQDCDWIVACRKWMQRRALK